MRTRNRTLAVLIFLLAAVGLPMLFIGPSHELDARLYYTHADAMSWLASLTPDERTGYLLNEYFDLGYLAVYSAIFYVFNGRWGLVPGVLDIIETMPIIIHLRTGSELPQFIPVVSSLKWIVGVIFVVKSIRKFYLTSVKAVPLAGEGGQSN